MHITKRKIGASASALLFLIFSPWIQADISLQLLKDVNSDLDWDALERGEVVSSDLADQEDVDAELVEVVAVKLNAPKEKVLEQLKLAGPEVKTIFIDTASAESIAQSLQNFQIDDRGDVHIDWFTAPKADGTFNASSEELALLQQVAGKIANVESPGPEDKARFTEVVRQILLGRIDEYRSSGLAGITPYDVDGEEIKAGDYLSDSMRTMDLLEEQEPDFYKGFLEYPKATAGDYMHDFHVVQELSEGRPITSLRHWMVKESDDFTLIAERKFYISHSLDAMHTLILAFQPEDATYLFMVNSTFTQKVTGFGSFVAHKVGRSKVRENILPLFEELKAHFE
jgi:hypothetical protein